MTTSQPVRISYLLLILSALPLLTVPGAAAAGTRYLDLSECGRRYAWTAAGAPEAVEIGEWTDIPPSAKSVGVVWDEERDIQQIQVTYGGSGPLPAVKVQYWFRYWPVPPPSMPTIEDRMDDIWQGKWLDAKVEAAADDRTVTYTFPPLDGDENPNAGNLPGVTYRRAMKVRLAAGAPLPAIQALRVHSGTTLDTLRFRVEFGCGMAEPETWSGGLEIYNGTLLSARPWNFEEGDQFRSPFTWREVIPGKPKGVLVEALAARPALAGSNDLTVVTVRAESRKDGQATPRTFSFSTRDLEKGPIYVPDHHAYVTLADDPKSFSPEAYKKGLKIRERIPAESEQTFERAGSEIPPQDPWQRQGGDRVYLPVAADASWQKFAVQYGGNFFISKRGTKAKGNELKRLQWLGDRIDFQIGTGETPYFREDQQAAMAVAEEHLPIILARWERDGLRYEQESFATLLEGPLDPEDPGRSEQTPAILMSRLVITNSSGEARSTRVWLAIRPAEALDVQDGRVFALAGGNGRYDAPRFRARVVSPDNQPVQLGALQMAESKDAVFTGITVPAHETKTVQFMIPFVSDMDEARIGRMERLDYGHERQRVADYWREMIERTTRFSTPEPEFNHLARFVIPHIHISATKDPQSGLYMVPAASYNYQVYANETCFQVLALDALGDTGRATQYLKTLLELQGSRSFPGNYAEPHDGVFHGARVNAEYDYTASSYGLDHGTVLWTLAQHYLYTRDAEWLKQTLPCMEKAVEWIERQRSATRELDRNGEKRIEYGLLPAGHLEDNDDWGYWFSVNAYCAAGLRDMALALEDIRHPRAAELREQADAFMNDLRTAIRRMTELAPVTRLRDGTYSPYVPTRLYQRFRYFGPLRVEYFSRYNLPDARPCYRLSATREVLYGPMILLNVGIFDVNEPIAEWILDDWEDNLTLSSSGGFNVHGFTDDHFWFSQGGMVFQSNLQNPVLVYLKRNETQAAIRGLYNNFVSCLYPEVNTLTEEYRMWSHASGPFYKSPDEARFVNRLRDALVLESGNDLWLASGAPRRWLQAPEGIQVDSINTWFGPVGYTLRPGSEERTIVARVRPPTRDAPDNLWLYVRVPEGRKITGVWIGGRQWTGFDPAAERVRLPKSTEPVDVVVVYE